jgi:hypothetical protein
MTDYITSLLRTAVPSLWGTALAWLVAHNVLDQVTADGAVPVASGLLVPLGIGVYYAVLRMIEPYLPTWLVALLLGSSRIPDYVGQAPKRP